MGARDTESPKINLPHGATDGQDASSDPSSTWLSVDLPPTTERAVTPFIPSLTSIASNLSTSPSTSLPTSSPFPLSFFATDPPNNILTPVSELSSYEPLKNAKSGDGDGDGDVVHVANSTNPGVYAGGFTGGFPGVYAGGFTGGFPGDFAGESTEEQRREVKAIVDMLDELGARQFDTEVPEPVAEMTSAVGADAIVPASPSASAPATAVNVLRSPGQVQVKTRGPVQGNPPPATAPTHRLSTSSSTASSILAQLHNNLAFSRDAHTSPSSPIVRTAPDAFSLRHPVPDLNTRSGAYSGNIAQLEAEAERLSTASSSIEDAIRRLHSDLKRSDSQHSSVLGAGLEDDIKNITHHHKNNASYNSDNSHGGGGDDDDNENDDNDVNNYDAVSPLAQLTRALSSRSGSVIDLNSVARNGGYSPGGYYRSPAHSFTGRLRSTSKGSEGHDGGTVGLSRNGTGKGSIRPTFYLAKVAEMEPISLTQEAFDIADRAGPADYSEAAHIQIPTSPPPHQLSPSPAPPQLATNATFPYSTPDYNTARGPDDDDVAVSQLTSAPVIVDPPRPRSDGSTKSLNTLEQAQQLFDDFDGVHCPPDLDLGPPSPPLARDNLSPEEIVFRRSTRQPTERPKSYFDGESNQQMLYYPARVPRMLNLPPKLSTRPKSNVVDVRRSRILAAMPDASRTSAAWLPEISPDPLPPLTHLSQDTTTSLEPSLSQFDASQGADAIIDRMESDLPTPDPSPWRAEHRQHLEPDRAVYADKRKSRMSVMSSGRLDNLPAQLRASAFFDLSPIQPDIEVKDGSAMATLDGILDASTDAPVNAFTDHAYAGKLGKEVYGKEKKLLKKRNAGEASTSNNPDSAAQRRHSTLVAPETETKKRQSVFSIFRKSGKDEDRRDTITGTATSEAAADVETTDEHDVANAAGTDALSANDYASVWSGRLKDLDESGSGEEDEDGSDDEVYNGPPTTLLAELQLRKQQQKMRTQPITKTYPNGLHSTLLELDAVAETQRNTRRGRRVNLAWEDPDAIGQDRDDDDEDVPLGVLLATRTNPGEVIGPGTGVGAASTNLPDPMRPFGLMELRNIEDNEPLSHRRARLQGQPIHPSMQGPRPASTLTTLQHQSMLNLSRPAMWPATSSSGDDESAAQGQLEADADEGGEIEGESLAQRMKRLRAREQNTLPRARPVSGAFSAELLSQFGDSEDKAKKVSDDAGEGAASNARAAPDNENETLGQRRRRLQAQRSAQPLGGMTLSATANPAAGGHGPDASRLSRRLSMANILAAHPRQVANPAAEERQRLEEEAMRQRAMEDRLRTMRVNIAGGAAGGVGGHAARGGFRGGAYNDGLGGGAWSGMSPATVGLLGGGPVIGMPMAPTDRVERWRQNVLP